MPRTNLTDAAQAIGRRLIAHYTERSGRVHLETVLGAASALAGEFALRATAPNLPTTGWVTGGAADRLIYLSTTASEPTLWSMIRDAATDKGADPAALPDPARVAARTTAAIGTSPYPPLSIPSEYYPHEWSPNASVRFRGMVSAEATAAGLGPTETAWALSVLIAMLLQQAPGPRQAEIGATLALEVMIGTSRMAPAAKEM